jgi:glutamyl-tRNA synthetase
LTEAERAAFDRAPAWRVKVPEKTYRLTDLCQGDFSQNIATDCGDFVVRRGDGVHVYQLAVTVDDGEAGVTEVVRGVDLLSSAPRQMYLQQLFGFDHPTYGHVPLLLAPDGRRLSKRDKDLDLGQLQKWLTPEELIGSLAHTCGLLEHYQPISARELAAEFSWETLKKEDIYLNAEALMR